MSTVVDEEFRQRLRLIMQQFGSVADLARAVGVSDNAIYKWVSGRGQPSMVSLVNLARAAGVSVEWLATGRGIPSKSKSEACAPESSDYVTMPRQGLRGVGGRDAIQNQQIVDFINFRSDWIQRVFNVDPRSLALVEAIGDSMSPTVDEGDLVLIDLRENRFKSDGLYVLRSGGDLSIKRLQCRPDGSLMIRSDNSAYEPQRVAQDDIVILGRVVWVGGRL
ncbi:MAG: XRE family transcriptional regulator [Candidatus Binataceae bacterium]